MVLLAWVQLRYGGGEGNSEGRRCEGQEAASHLLTAGHNRKHVTNASCKQYFLEISLQFKLRILFVVSR